uniref:Protein kinase domain-containing protein n=1 Tax=Graphocephala atropunctata TaxID=36148 RepID=A0A1B6KLU7_9HEMI
MARGKRAKSKYLKKYRDDEEKQKLEQVKSDTLKKQEEKSSSRAHSYFKSEELQDICGLLNVDELGDHHCFLGAVVIGKFDIVKRLLKDGFSVDTMDENRETALMHAVKHFRYEMVDFLVTRGADISLVDVDGNNALLLAAQSALWDQDSFSDLWNSVRDHPWLRPNHTNQAGYSLLHYVTKRQWKLVLESLLRIPVTLDTCTNKGVTPLILAASRGDSAFVRALLDKGADFTVEDQQKCTALCYAIAFSVQKNGAEAKQALEFILSAINDENSKLPLEVYLQRRLDVLVTPPKSKSEFSKTVTSVLVHVLTFFARLIYSGMDLLLELSVFHRLKEAVECHMEDAVYTAAVMAVVLELVRHSNQCCQEGLSQHELADAFFNAGLGNCCLDILHRYGTGKTVMIKAVFMPLVYICTSESYLARMWLQCHQDFLQSFYNKYMRSFPAIFLETNGDLHLELEKKNSLSFQKIMKVLKTEGQIVSKEEHCRAAQKLKVDSTSARYAYTAKPNTPNGIINSFKASPESKLGMNCTKRKISKPSAIYNSIIQYNFGKLDIVQTKKDKPKERPEREQPERTQSEQDQPEQEQSEKEQHDTDETSPVAQSITKVPQTEKKSRIAIKEIQRKQSSVTCKTLVCSDQDGPQISGAKESRISSEDIEVKHSDPSLNDSYKRSTLENDVKDQFSAGYQLFKMEEEVLHTNSDEENIKTQNACDWLDNFTAIEGNKSVSDDEVANTMNYLEEIFNRIVSRYKSTWKKEFEEGYIEAEGDSEDVLKLKMVLPALENYHMDKLILKWKKFCQQIQDHARKKHIVYAAMVSEMQLFLLEFEAELDSKDIKIQGSVNSSLTGTVSVREAINCVESDLLANQKSEQNVVNITSIESSENTEKQSNKIMIESDSPVVRDRTVEFIDSIYISDSEEKDHDLSSTCLDDKVQYINIEPTLDIDKNIEKPKVEISEETPAIKETDCDEINQEMLNENEDSVIEKCSTDIENCDLTPVLENENNNDESMDVVKMIYSNQPSVMALQTLFEDYAAVTQSSTEFEMPLSKKENEESTAVNGYASKNKPPPGFENDSVNNAGFKNKSSVLTYCGTKYQTLSLALITLPACKTELLDGGNLRLASIEYQLEFKLFNGCNFGDVELGLNGAGTPLAVRRFQKHNSLCNKTISKTLFKQISNMLDLKHRHILPYTVCHDLPGSLVFAMPLCYLDLGQYIRHLRAVILKSPDSISQLMPKLLIMVKQIMSGLHYLHTHNTPIVHGNLKPSNVLADAKGNLRLAEFGVHEVLFQQQGPAQTSMIWWSRDCLIQYYYTWKFECTQQSDIQTAGMLVHFVLTLGQHPYGQSLTEIIENIKKSLVLIRCQDVIDIDLIYWMLSLEPDKRPTTFDVLRHVMFWNTSRRWEFLLTCCGMGPGHKSWPLPLDQFYRDLDFLGALRDINSKWISVLKQNCEHKIGSNVFEDSPSGLLKFLKNNLENWSEVKDVFLELFPVLPLNLYRLVEQTVWIDHPEFEPFTRVEALS